MPSLRSTVTPAWWPPWRAPVSRLNSAVLPQLGFAQQSHTQESALGDTPPAFKYRAHDCPCLTCTMARLLVPQHQSGLPYPHGQRVAPRRPAPAQRSLPGTKPISSKRSKVLCSRPSRAGTSPVTSAGVHFQSIQAKAADGERRGHGQCGGQRAGVQGRRRSRAWFSWGTAFSQMSLVLIYKTEFWRLLIQIRAALMVRRSQALCTRYGRTGPP